jgi:hypothetical protein
VHKVPERLDRCAATPRNANEAQNPVSTLKSLISRRTRLSGLKDLAEALGFRDFPGLPVTKANRNGGRRTLYSHRLNQ